jgi:hypothetical protein
MFVRCELQRSSWPWQCPCPRHWRWRNFIVGDRTRRLRQIASRSPVPARATSGSAVTTARDTSTTTGLADATSERGRIASGAVVTGIATRITTTTRPAAGANSRRRGCTSARRRREVEARSLLSSPRRDEPSDDDAEEGRLPSLWALGRARVVGPPSVGRQQEVLRLQGVRRPLSALERLQDGVGRGWDGGDGARHVPPVPVARERWSWLEALHRRRGRRGGADPRPRRGGVGPRGHAARTQRLSGAPAARVHPRRRQPADADEAPRSPPPGDGRAALGVGCWATMKRTKRCLNLRRFSG